MAKEHSVNLTVGHPVGPRFNTSELWKPQQADPEEC